MEITQLKYFYEVACTEHVTRAAERLHIAQPALTQAIHRLEKELKVPLFAPKGRNIVLTEYGLYLKKKAEPILEAWEKIPTDLELMAHLDSTTIHMNVMSASTAVTESIIAYKKQAEHIHFQLVQNQEFSLCDIDIFTRLFYQKSETASDNEYVFTEKIYLAVPNNEKYRKLEAVALADVSQEEFICLAGFKQFRQICDKFCAHAGFQPKVIFESDNVASVKNMIAAGLGIGFWPQFTWGELDTHDVLLLPIVSPKCQRDIVIACNSNKGDNGEVKRYFEYLVRYLEEWQGRFPSARRGISEND